MEVLLARGDAAAAAVAERAATTADGNGAPLDTTDGRLLALRALAAARELRRLGTRVSAESRRAAHGRSPATLTERERRIAERVADGHSNKQIAATLFRSEKTVRNTLTRVYAKLGVRSRTQLTRTLTPR
jgi:DNA-binding NarL/FixJ family response regulator